MVFYAGQFIYAWLQAEAGRRAGAAPTEVSVGLGPAVVCLQHGRDGSVLGPGQVVEQVVVAEAQALLLLRGDDVAKALVRRIEGRDRREADGRAQSERERA